MSVLIRRLCLTTAVSCMSWLLVACGPQRLPSGLVYCSEGNPESFNPQLVTSGTTIDATSHQIYSRLVDYDTQSGKLVPALATSWAMSDDGLSYRFTLRENVQFQHSKRFTPTRPFNADDVLFSFKRIIDTQHPYHFVSRTGYPFFQSIGFSEQVKGIEKINDHEVVFYLTRKDASFLSNLATDFAVILSDEYAQQQLALGHPENVDHFAIGTGPFTLVQYAKNEYIRYRRHPDFWGEPAKIDMLVFDITPKSTVRLAKLIAGDCSVSALPKAGELPVIKQHEELNIESQPGLNVAFWAFNTQKPPLNDVRVRRALAYAVDKQNILRAVYQNTAIEATGVLPPASWAYDNNKGLVDYNPQKARDLLKEAGIKNLSIDIWAMPVARAYNPNALKTAELIQSDLANIGVKVNIVSYDWSVFSQRLSRDDYDSVLIGWNADNSDPDNFFTPLLSCAAMQSNNNRSRWCNPEFDAILDNAREVSDQGERKVIYQQAEAFLAEQVPMLSLAHAKRVALTRHDVKDMQLTPFGGISFAQTSQAQEEAN
ncbi:ABC transporter substrate-binding protein SapA [Shewanella baltica]|uniref:ABC transporter substrate-binding protein SapA n=1 Tax=Shewanella baltica TaxID=62322 RepID=UPI0000DE1086|nr:ABC transporter substrate-binding protein SapA [Shewanella baltica]ADT93850.1 extracellular solute-binding protein family 5 [Shewanella baltica OS678]MCS6136926.1 peptide ABC transporter substrate-binding protein SapA [Shewanella baltica]HCE52515.1 peptide ABC transporter substrate-binding protein SapA [Shewanella baltica]